MFNLEQIRKDTLHCEDKIFLSSAGCSLPPKSMFEKMHAYNKLEEEFGGYPIEALKSEDRNRFYKEAARLINCRPDNISFQYSATEGFSRALSAIPFCPGDVILTTDDDYISNFIAFISLKKRFGIEIIRTENTEFGELDILDFEQKIIAYKPKLVAITQVPTNSGLVQPVTEVGKLCKKYDILYLLDACQAVGQMVVDVQEIACDFLNATGRKFLRGPRTSGFLYVSDKALNLGLEPLFIDRRGADWVEAENYVSINSALRFEPKEVGVEIIGLAESLAYTNRIGIDNIEEYNKTLGERLRSNLSQINDLVLLDRGLVQSNIITFYIKNKTLEQVEAHLKANKVYYSPSLKSYAIIDFTKKGVDWAIRFSPNYFNTIEEMDAVSEIVNQLVLMS
ncbi:aminotransferase class V-fold PLP-dependent enzyme [Lacihabitans sp. CCS-44]|uniref:aminotransferase class V-fold PLP-dependent enzyme n=1 Tax=Lacihabitans sp. CCS-44 TaxID=2487331 RepID=UPI0020CD0B55|nr:aminotransferase class V-fold PLP-dependent enzyme [Lacihabitans sp. CCS-44]MCP9756858.1 aminotransferase class V-fold PLP-dependent enzyme [Lacihabitans sp. CCS-44]